MNAWADELSVDITPTQALNDGGVSPITVVCAKGDGSSAPQISGGQLRLYQADSGKTTGNTITFSSEKTITKIVFTFANNMTADNGEFSEGNYDSDTFTWTGSTNSVTLTVTGTTTGKRIYITAMTVYYENGSQTTTFSVTYDANGATSGSVPTDDTEYEENDEVTVLGNIGDLAKTGYAFGGWNTQADGEGTNYDEDDTFEITADMTLYAKWNVKTITELSYSGTPTKKTYDDGDSFDPTGLTVTATYDDSSSEDVTSSVVWTPDPLTAGTTSVTGTYMGLTVNVTGITVNNVTKITITQDNLSNFTNTYNWYDWSSGGVSGRAYAYKKSGMQFNSSKDGYWIYNTTQIPGTITSVKMVKASGNDRSWTLKAGTSEISAINEGTQIGNAQTVGTSGATWDVTGSYNYFLLYVSGGSTVISSIEITYIPSTAPIINADATVDLEADDTSGEIAYTISNPVDGTSLTASVEQGCEWISDVTVGTDKVNTTGNERSATITLTYGSATKDITVTQAKPVVTVNYTLANAVVPGRHYIITNGTDGEIKALGAQNGNYRNPVAVNADNGALSIEENAGVYEFLINVHDDTGFYTLYDVTNEGYLYANSNSSNNVNVEASLDNKNNGVWAINIEDGVATIMAQGSNTHNLLLYNSQNPRFSCYDSHNLNDIYLFERDNDDSPVQTTITISPATGKTYTTFCRAIDLDFTNVSGIEAYVVSNMSASSATITQVFTLPAGEGAILKRTDNGASESFDIPFAESANAIATNYMVGITKAKDMSGIANAYILKDGLFYECSGGTLAAGKAYLNDENGVWATSSSPSFSLIVDGETTGIDSLTPALNQGEGVYYDLSGRRIAEPTKGIYILNGKKVVVK